MSLKYEYVSGSPGPQMIVSMPPSAAAKTEASVKKFAPPMVDAEPTDTSRH